MVILNKKENSMQDFVYNSNVKIIYGENQLPLVIKEMKKIGNKLLIVSTNSFISGGHLEILENELKKEEFETTILKSGKEPLLSKVKEGIQLCLENNIEVVLGIGGGVSMDLAKSIAFGTLNNETPLEQYLTYQCSTAGLSHLPLITIPTNPTSGSETNEDVQITLDESGLQVGCPLARATFTWLNPIYMMSLPKSILTYGQMTAFVQLSINYLNLTRSPLAEHYAEGSMKTIIDCLRRCLAHEKDVDAYGTLLINSALSLSGINDFGRTPEFIPYPLQSFAQRYLGINYTQALNGLFPYWLKEIYRASDDKAIFYRYFKEILNVDNTNKEDETLLQEALQTLKALYQEFGIAFTYNEIASDPQNHQHLVDLIDSFGPMPCHIMSVTTEKLANMIEDAIVGNLN